MRKRLGPVDDGMDGSILVMGFSSVNYAGKQVSIFLTPILFLLLV
jgi:hypothetical protein